MNTITLTQYPDSRKRPWLRLPKDYIKVPRRLGRTVLSAVLECNKSDLAGELIKFDREYRLGREGIAIMARQTDWHQLNGKKLTLLLLLSECRNQYDEKQVTLWPAIKPYNEEKLRFYRQHIGSEMDVILQIYKK